MNNISNYKKELRLRILSVAIEMFKKNGIKSVKMDDIANAMQISKRTLYELYDNKEKLLLECMREDNLRIRSHMADFLNQADNEMDVVIEFFRIKMEDLENISPYFFLELQKYSNVVSYLRSLHEEDTKKSLEFIKRGIEHGYFLKGLNYEIVVKIAEASTNYFITNKMYMKYDTKELFRNFWIVLMRGFCTSKGAARLTEIFKDE